MKEKNIPLISKLPEVKTTIFSVMSALASKHNAINLSQGFPDFPADEKLLDLVSNYMKKGFNQYAPMSGTPQLRAQISTKLNISYNKKISSESEITVTSGATEALFAAISAIVNKDDEVIIFEPAYDSYIPAIQLNGGIPISIKLQENNYSIDWDIVKKKINNKTKAIIINTPHNPTGSTLEENDMKKLSEIVANTDIIIISDEVYEHIIFDKKAHQSILKYPELSSRGFAIFSFGKTFHTTGWKIGYCVAPQNLTNEFRKVHQYITFSTVTPMQLALAEYMTNKETYLSLPDFFENKRIKFASALEKTPFEILPCSGTYFQLASFKNISDKTDTDFAIWLTEKFGVATIPISVFYSDQTDNKVIRFCFAKEDATLEEAVERLSKI